MRANSSSVIFLSGIKAPFQTNDFFFFFFPANRRLGVGNQIWSFRTVSLWIIVLAVTICFINFKLFFFFAPGLHYKMQMKILE